MMGEIYDFILPWCCFLSLRCSFLFSRNGAVAYPMFLKASLWVMQLHGTVITVVTLL